MKEFIGFIIGVIAVMLGWVVIATCIGQWLWSVFCECINCKPMTFWQMMAFQFFFSGFVILFKIGNKQ